MQVQRPGGHLPGVGRGRVQTARGRRACRPPARRAGPFLSFRRDRHRVRRAFRAEPRNHCGRLALIRRRRGRHAHGRGRLRARACHLVCRGLSAQRRWLRHHCRVGGVQRAVCDWVLRDLHPGRVSAAAAHLVAARARLLVLCAHPRHPRDLHVRLRNHALGSRRSVHAVLRVRLFDV